MLPTYQFTGQQNVNLLQTRNNATLTQSVFSNFIRKIVEFSKNVICKKATDFSHCLPHQKIYLYTKILCTEQSLNTNN